MASNSEIEKLERRWQENPLGLTFAPLAEAYRKAGETAKALELLEVGLAQHPNYVPAHIVRGRCHVDAQQPALAEQSFRRVTELDPENAIALKGLADLAESEGRVSEAIARLETMLEVDRNNEDARGQLDRLRELPEAAAPEPEVELAEQELSLAAKGEYQSADASAELVPSDDAYPEIVLQAAELEKSLPVAEAAQGSDAIAEPDPAAAVGHAGLDEDAGPLAVLDEAESYEPAMVAEPVLDSFEPEAPSPEPISESFEPEVVPEPIELVQETEAVLAVEPEPVEAESAESVSPPEPAALSEPQPEPEPEAEPVAEPASEGETAPAEPELVVTETMAEIFLRQGHRELALAV
ncbi:MAG TPA: tetratricopeptide repeat protein, partial [Gemmatimonadales bacterium]|nr:tetratricopeptide repeat protein [Gemmatimonadales bacterium]